MKELILPSPIKEQIISCCRDGLPDEACGILAGSANRVEKLYPVTNIDRSPVSYLMDPREQFCIMKEMRSDGTQMLAIYHSHPVSVPFPSDKDIGLAFYSDCIYLIISLVDVDNPEIRAFSIVDGRVDEVRIVIEKCFC